MIPQTQLKKLAEDHGTPLFVVDHDVLRRNFAEFRKHLPRVQPYYAVKANPDPAIVKALYHAGASFDVASFAEFMIVHGCIKNLPPKARQDFIWDKIIYANPIKAKETLSQLDPYKPLVTFDNIEEIRKMQEYSPQAGLVLRVKVPNTGSLSELSSKFGAAPGEAVDLIEAAKDAGFTVEGISFHVGSQATNFDNYVLSLNISRDIFREAKLRGHDKMNLLDIGGGFPAPYDRNVKRFTVLAKLLRAEIRRLFPRDIQILAEPGRFMVATAATLVVEIIGKSVREGKLCYYIDDGIYGTFSGILFDHNQYHLRSFKKGTRQICSVFGPTCDALDTVSRAEQLPNLKLGELLYARNVGAYTTASATTFNGFAMAKVVHVNQ
jgi:ornithine decarboxylase